jgi:ABC-2 type transport system ATP-binding protein
MLKVDDLHVSYGRINAVQGLTLEVREGELVGLIGHNGAGKSTTIKAITGQLNPSRGAIEFEGRSIRGCKSDEILRRGISLVPEGRRIFSRLSVGENLRIGTSARRDKAAARADVHAMAERFEVLGRYFDRPAGLLSGGEQQQLAIARALLSRPRLLVLDEPTLGLDLLFRRSFYDNLLNDYFNKERTIVVTTHQVEEIEHILTDVLFIQHGKVRLDTTMEGLAERFVQLVPTPANLERARALEPFWEREIFGRVTMLFDGGDAAELATLGETRPPSVADLFVAMMQAVIVPTKPSKEAA